MGACPLSLNSGTRAYPQALPAGDGEPGQAYVTWVKTVHSGDVTALKGILPAEMAEQLDSVTREETQEEIQPMQAMTTTEVNIVGGSSDGEIAVPEIQGTMEGETVDAEVTMTKFLGFWIPTGSRSRRPPVGNRCSAHVREVISPRRSGLGSAAATLKVIRGSARCSGLRRVS